MDLYFIETCIQPRRLKVGVSSNVLRRLKQLQTGNGQDLRLIGTLPCKSSMQAREIEKQWHARLIFYKMHGEWFKFPRPVRLLVWAALSGSLITFENACAYLRKFTWRVKRKGWKVSLNECTS